MFSLSKGIVSFFTLIPFPDSAFHFTFTSYFYLLSYFFLSRLCNYRWVISYRFFHPPSLHWPYYLPSTNVAYLRRKILSMSVCYRKHPPGHLNVQAICQTQTYYVVSVTAVFPKGQAHCTCKRVLRATEITWLFMTKVVPSLTSYQNRYVDYSSKYFFNIYFYPLRILDLATLLL